jgi:murein DD-endopeptidase MepM/ murein hydrolase activator NlpD
MRKIFLLLLGLFLASCAPVIAVPSPTAIPQSATPTFLLFTPSPLFPTLTIAPTDTATATPAFTNTPTSTPTDTPVPLVYFFPVQPPSAATFAEGTSSHGYPATDLFAPVGTKFVAVTGGVVDYVSGEDIWEPELDNPAWRGGLSVAIIGDDGVRYYGAHLSSVEPGIKLGVRVEAGQVLGRTGNSGDARFTTPHLHFGISPPTYPEDWRVRRGEVDPYPYLLMWREGQEVTPSIENAVAELGETDTPFHYNFPVQPANKANFSQGGHGYPATDIFAPTGTLFVAVTDGVVDSVSYEDRWDPATNEPGTSAGLWVSILGDDGVRYFGAHLSSIAEGIRPGVRVGVGDLLGLVGNSGEARNGMPHLHFEISRPTSPTDWMSRESLIYPFPFLQAWKAGHNVTPPMITP